MPTPSPAERADPFADLADVYQAMIDWPRRLAHEQPFYRRLIDQLSAGSVLDVACGTGHHAAMFHSLGLRVEAADISPAMIDRARRTFGQPDGLRWTVRPFDQPSDAGPFDLAICVGNSLALAADLPAVQRALAAMFASVRPGGAVVVHVLNLWALPDGPCIWQKCLRTTIAGADVLVIKGVHRSGDRGFVELLIAEPAGKLLKTQSAPFLGLRGEDLSAIAARHGCDNITLHGGYAGQPYEEARSTDLIMVAQRRT